MAKNVLNVAVGGLATINISPWVTANGAGTFTDVGLVALGGWTLDYKREDYIIEAESDLGNLGRIPTKREITFKFKCLEVDFEKWRVAFGQPTGNLTGTFPTQSFKYDHNAVAQEFQVQIVGRGASTATGTSKTRTISLWKCVPIAVEPIIFERKGPQMVGITMDVLSDLSSTLGAFQGVDS